MLPLDEQDWRAALCAQPLAASRGRTRERFLVDAERRCRQSYPNRAVRWSFFLPRLLDRV